MLIEAVLGVVLELLHICNSIWDSIVVVTAEGVKVGI
jgi:hypothetical protein